MEKVTGCGDGPGQYPDHMISGPRTNHRSRDLMFSIAVITQPNPYQNTVFETFIRRSRAQSGASVIMRPCLFDSGVPVECTFWIGKWRQQLERGCQA